MSEIKREIWSKQIFNQLVEAGISLFAYIPDFGNDNIIKLAEEHNETRAILLTSEEEGVGICTGADLVGRRAVLCMQSSGVGNCPNFLSLIKGGGFPIFLLVTMRLDNEFCHRFSLKVVLPTKYRYVQNRKQQYAQEIATPFDPPQCGPSISLYRKFPRMRIEKFESKQN